MPRFLIILFLGIVSFADAQAQPSEGMQTTAIPALQFSRKNLKIDMGCKREFLYEGQLRRLDSFDCKNAEHLRPLIQGIPQAVAELDAYQKNRKNLVGAAYIGTIGLVAMILANNLLRNDKVGDLGENIARYGGIGLLGGSALFSLVILQTNESHLTKAVTYHNQANPDRAIELQFSTEFTF